MRLARQKPPETANDETIGVLGQLSADSLWNEWCFSLWRALLINTRQSDYMRLSGRNQQAISMSVRFLWMRFWHEEGEMFVTPVYSKCGCKARLTIQVLCLVDEQKGDNGGRRRATRIRAALAPKVPPTARHSPDAVPAIGGVSRLAPLLALCHRLHLTTSRIDRRCARAMRFRRIVLGEPHLRANTANTLVDHARIEAKLRREPFVDAHLRHRQKRHIRCANPFEIGGAAGVRLQLPPAWQLEPLA